jgi:hypothetical protein
VQGTVLDVYPNPSTAAADGSVVVVLDLSSTDAATLSPAAAGGQLSVSVVGDRGGQ